MHFKELSKQLGPSKLYNSHLNSITCNTWGLGHPASPHTQKLHAHWLIGYFSSESRIIWIYTEKLVHTFAIKMENAHEPNTISETGDSCVCCIISVFPWQAHKMFFRSWSFRAMLLSTRRRYIQFPNRTLRFVMHRGCPLVTLRTIKNWNVICYWKLYAIYIGAWKRKHWIMTVTK